MSTRKPSSIGEHPAAVKPASTTTGAASDRPASPSLPVDWTRPYCETSHMLGLKRGYQITMTEWPEGKPPWSEVCVLRGFQPLCQFSGTREACVAWAEQRARGLRLIEEPDTDEEYPAKLEATRG